MGNENKKRTGLQGDVNFDLPSVSYASDNLFALYILVTSVNRSLTATYRRHYGPYDPYFLCYGATPVSVHLYRGD